MNTVLNNYLRVLLHLKQFEGDGQFHDIDDLLDIDNKGNIYLSLKNEGYLELKGGASPKWTFGKIKRDGYGGREYESKTIGGGYTPHQAKLTFKGSKYLKEELQMIDKDKYNINIGDNSTANLIMHSPGATINNKTELIDKAKAIIDTVLKDGSISVSTKNEAVKTLNTFISEVEVGQPSKFTLDKILTFGSNVSSIGSLILSLLQLINT